MACMDELSNTQSPNLIFSLGERKVAGERSQKLGALPTFKWEEALLWNEHTGRGMVKCCGERDTEIYFKIEIYENGLVPEEKES